MTVNHSVVTVIEIGIDSVFFLQNRMQLKLWF